MVAFSEENHEELFLSVARDADRRKDQSAHRDARSGRRKVERMRPCKAPIGLNECRERRVGCKVCPVTQFPPGSAAEVTDLT